MPLELVVLYRFRQTGHKSTTFSHFYSYFPCNNSELHVTWANFYPECNEGEPFCNESEPVVPAVPCTFAPRKMTGAYKADIYTALLSSFS